MGTEGRAVQVRSSKATAAPTEVKTAAAQQVVASQAKVAPSGSRPEISKKQKTKAPNVVVNDGKQERIKCEAKPRKEREDEKTKVDKSMPVGKDLTSAKQKMREKERPDLTKHVHAEEKGNTEERARVEGKARIRN